ncbi:hypothetical protein ACS0TY_023835 [Phlomoides rotata]
MEILKDRFYFTNISRLSDRNFSIGADGVILALPCINDTDYTMQIFNSDGREPEMCGNGVRCFARFIAELENLEGKQRIVNFLKSTHLSSGVSRNPRRWKDDMGQPNLQAPDDATKLTPNKDQVAVKAKLDVNGLIWNVTCVSMGNPYCVTFGSESCNIHHLDYNFFSPMRVIRVQIFSFADCVTQDLQEDELD